LWQVFRNNSKDLTPDSPIISMYMEDESGKPISPGIKSTLRGDLTSYWNDVHNSGAVLTNFTDLGLDRKDDFRKTFEIRYPWLRLCEAHWKVDHLWINYFGSWRKSRNSPGPGVDANKKRQPSLPSPSEAASDPSPVPIRSSVEAADGSVGSKRRREEFDDPTESLKRLKGKEREILSRPTVFHHPPPVSKKAAARQLAKASNLQSC
jgi:hypothetical protein